MGEGREKGKMKGVLIDIDYVTKGAGARWKEGQAEGEKSGGKARAEERAIIRMFLKGKEKMFKLYDDSFEPYIYVEGNEKLIPKLMAISAKGKMGEILKFTRAEKISKWIAGVKKDVLKVYCMHPGDVPILRDYLADFKIFEHNIPFALRYIIDKQLPPLQEIEFEYEKIGKRKRVTKFLGVKDTGFKLKAMSFDIETYNPQGVPRMKIDPIVMISYATEEKGGKVLTYKKVPGKEFVQVMNDEGEMLKRFGEVLNENDVEMLVGYNSAMFDLPYMQERANVLKVPLKLGRDGSSFRARKAGMRDVAKIMGRLHIDLYPIIWFLSYIGAMKVSSLTLKNAYKEIMGKPTMEIERLDIWRMWEDETERKMLADYSLADAKSTLELAEKVLPAEVELSKISHMPLMDVCNASSGQMVETLLMSRSFLRDEIIPNKPTGEEAKARSENPIEGAYVKLPIPGLYENIAVFDFRGLYPSIIISHNIDGGTLNCTDCNDPFVSPQGHRFCKKKQGLIPQVLDELITKRGELKDALKKLKPGTDEYQRMFARQWALKILANSFYGYMAYPRSRWYSRASAESVTGWGRYYIQDTIKRAEEAGFEVLYGDTDSIFLLMKGKTKEQVLDFMKSINKELPEKMELEFEGFYPRGVFVTKKQGGKGAKKKYALIGEDDRIKIRGFELVRRDWSSVAKNTQKKVLEAILKEGSKDKAVKIVRETIELLKGGKVPLAELAIVTQIKKPLDKYEIISPEVEAAKKAVKRGKKEIGMGSIVSYVITRKGQSISDKAELLEYAKDYDAAYYIDHQILPAVLKILKELGYDAEDLKTKGTQKNMSEFFG